VVMGSCRAAVHAVNPSLAWLSVRMVALAAWSLQTLGLPPTDRLRACVCHQGHGDTCLVHTVLLDRVGCRLTGCSWEAE
jgi:hypothetical protein